MIQRNSTQKRDGQFRFSSSDRAECIFSPQCGHALNSCEMFFLCCCLNRKSHWTSCIIFIHFHPNSLMHKALWIKYTCISKMFLKFGAKVQLNSFNFWARRWQREASSEQRAAHCFNSHLSKHQSLSQLLGSVWTHSRNPPASATSLMPTPVVFMHCTSTDLLSGSALCRWRSLIHLFTCRCSC